MSRESSALSGFIRVYRPVYIDLSIRVYQGLYTCLSGFIDLFIRVNRPELVCLLYVSFIIGHCSFVVHGS